MSNVHCNTMSEISSQPLHDIMSIIGQERSILRRIAFLLQRTARIGEWHEMTFSNCFANFMIEENKPSSRPSSHNLPNTFIMHDITVVPRHGNPLVIKHLMLRAFTFRFSVLL